MIPIPSGVRVWLATGHTDMRKGFASLGLIVQETLKRDPHGGHLFVFRGRRGDLIKVIWHDGQGACLYTKRLDRGRFLCPRRRMERSRSRPHNSATSSPGSTGGCRRRAGARPRLAEDNALQGLAIMLFCEGADRA